MRAGPTAVQSVRPYVRLSTLTQTPGSSDTHCSIPSVPSVSTRHYPARKHFRKWYLKKTKHEVKPHFMEAMALQVSGKTLYHCSVHGAAATASNPQHPRCRVRAAYTARCGDRLEATSQHKTLVTSSFRHQSWAPEPFVGSVGYLITD